MPELVPVTSAIVMVLLLSIRIAHVTEPCNGYGHCIRPAAVRRLMLGRSLAGARVS